MYRASTFRVKWKKIGGHGNETAWGYGSNGSHGKWYRRMLHKAERRYYKNYAKAYVNDPEIEPHVRDGGIRLWNSEVNWKGS